MKCFAFSLLLVALLAGCSSSPTKQAAIEDRSATPTETKTVADQPLVETTGKPTEEAVTTGQATPPLSTQAMASKSADAVQTSGLAAPSAEVKGLADANKVAVAPVASTPVAIVRDTSILPYSGGANQTDLKDPNSLLSKRRIMFDFNSDAIGDDFRPLLEAHAQYLKTNSSAKVILQGNTDERGSREYNLALGQRRAESVLKALNLLGVPEGQMEAVSMGEEKPIAEGHDEAAWAQNRRTEILYQGE